ncbi:helix-turn-helix domain-containing protein [Nocardia salmonicida]|uniref:helix-turn-helix domain-containing protein n=1 Tax=Nocardia TaxID=1817 RepID=UPI002659F5CE|nr:helix-turn-helix domain-containing protein [Nocardia sp. PE-7]WKG08099.1 helix-turn-helix domain-containing protein [Nocardia sp. PE-7]
MATIEVFRADDLGPALREARIAEDLTQQDLASIAGVGRQWLNAFEAGQKGSAPLDMVMRVITALGVSVTLSRRAPELSFPVDEEPIDLDSLVDGPHQ